MCALLGTQKEKKIENKNVREYDHHTPPTTTTKKDFPTFVF